MSLRTLLKLILAVGGLALALVIGLAIVIALILEPEDYRPLIVKTIEESTGRSFDLQGELDLELFPCCSIALGRSVLGNPAGFPGPPFATVDSAALSLRIWPLLLRREVDIDQIVLEGLDLKLLRLADGRTNWVFGESAESSDASGERSGSRLAELKIAGLQLRQGRLSYRDLEAQTAYTAEEFRLESGAIAPGRVFALETELKLTDETDGTSAHLALASGIELAAEGVLMMSPRLQIEATGPIVPARRARALVTASDARLDLGDEAFAITGLESTLELEALKAAETNLAGDARISALELDLVGGTGELSSLELNLEALGARARVTASGQVGGREGRLGGRFEVPETSLRPVLKAFLADGDRPAARGALGRFSGSGRWLFEGGGLALEDIALQVDETRLIGTARIEDFENRAATLDLQLDRIDLDRYRPSPVDEKLPKAPQEPTQLPLGALAGRQLNATLRVRELRVAQTEFADVQLTLGLSGGKADLSLRGHGLEGSVSLDARGDVASAEPALDGSLSLQDVSPRALLAALEKSLQTADPAVLSRLSGNSRWRLGPRWISLDQMSWQLDETRITGRLRIDDFDRAAARFDLSLDRLNLDAYAAPDDPADSSESAIPVDLIRELDLKGRFRADELTVAETRLSQVSAEIEARNGLLSFTPLQAALLGGEYRGHIMVDARDSRARVKLDQQVIAVQLGEILTRYYATDRLVGSLSMQLSASGTGNSQSELLKTLTGTYAISLSDGAYRGMDLLYELRKARSLLRREPLPTEPARKETRIRTLAQRGEMLDGVLRSEDLVAEIPLMRLKGSGGLDLLDHTLDYKLNAQIMREPDAPSGHDLMDLLKGNIPISIQGAMAAPKIGVDLKGLAVNTVREQLQERARDALSKRLGLGSREDATGRDTTDPGPSPAPAELPPAQPETPKPEQSDGAEPPESAPEGAPLPPQGLLDRNGLSGGVDDASSSFRGVANHLLASSGGLASGQACCA